MKFLFTLSVGVVIGWISSICDVNTQLALEQHQLQMDTNLTNQAAAAGVEEAETTASYLFSWP